MIPLTLAPILTKIDARLELIATGWATQQGLGSVMAYALSSGGKRLRPLLAASLSLGLLQKQRAATPRHHEAALEAACMIELVHVASLIADDLPCMDNDDERRGKPSVHRAFGESSSILAIVALITNAFERLSASSSEAICPERAREAVVMIGRSGGLFGAAKGQWMDLQISQGAVACHQEMLRLKTGSFFEAALWGGWGFGAGAGEGRELIAPAAHALGLAYQCLDDLDDQKQDGAASAVRAWGAESTTAAVHDHLATFRGACRGLCRGVGPLMDLCSWMEAWAQNRVRDMASAHR